MSIQSQRPPGQHGDAYFKIAAGLLLVFMAILAGGAALRESVTVDEVAHIGAGLSYLQKFDLRLNEEHPPLPKILAAIPLVLRGTHADYSSASWTFSGEKFFGSYLGQWVFGAWVLNRWNDPVSTLAWARFPMLLLTLALGWCIFEIGRRLGGNWGGLLCLSIYVSTPLFLAFGPLVHTDIAVTLFTLLALWTFAEIWREPTSKKSLLFGLCLAGALLSKFTSGILFFAFGIFALTTRWWPVTGQPTAKPEKRIWRRHRWKGTLKGIGWASAFVYVFYFIFSIGQSTDILYLVGHGPAFVPIRRLLMPAWLYLRGLFLVLLTASRPTFILGHIYPHGVWFYYPIVFVLKSPLGFLALLALTLIIAILRKRILPTLETVVPETFRVHWRVLWVSLIVFTVVCMLGRLDISIRHFSVPVALIILMLAPLPRMLERLQARAPLVARVGVALVIVLAASCLLTAARTYPFYFPFVNSLSFGHPTYTLLHDSNVDWNQSLPEVKKFTEQRGLQRVALDWYGLSDSIENVPGSYEWDCEQPNASDGGVWAVISSNLILESRNCSWLLDYPHESLAAGSMLAVHLPGTIPSAGSPGGPPLPSQFHQFFGMPFDLRPIFIDLYKNPDRIPVVYEQMAAKFQQQYAAQKNKGASPAAQPH